MFERIWIDGRIEEAAEARLSPALAGALYGWGVFTTLGVTRGFALGFDLHWTRLCEHAERLSVEVPWEKEEVEAGLLELLRQGNVVEGRARITVMRACAGLWQLAGGRESVTTILVGSRPERDARPLALTVSPHRLNTASPLAGLKTTAYVDHLLAFDEARERGFDEALMLNERGEIAEATSANVFWVRDGELFTPSLATGCIAGVTRHFVLEAAERFKIRITEGSYKLAMMGDADEVFLSNSGWGLTAVSQFDIHRYSPAPGPTFERLEPEVSARLLAAGRGARE